MPGWENGSTRQWRKIRKQVLDRDRHRCQLNCEPACDCTRKNCSRFHGCTTIATVVHHIDGKRHGDNPERLAAACRACNLHIGDPEKSGHDPEPVTRTAW